MLKNDCGKTDAAKEAGDIYALCGKDLARSMELTEKQLNVLQSRAQVLMSLASVVLTITGFSGSRIAGTNLFSKVCVITGLAMVLLSAIWIWRNVMYVKWITGDIDAEPVAVLARIIERRNKKTQAYMIGGFILCVGFVIYSIAFINMLLFNVN